MRYNHIDAKMRQINPINHIGAGKMAHKAGFYTADSANGVLYHGTDRPDDDECEWAEISPKDFLDSLKSVEDNECLYAHFTEKDLPLLDTIESEYGIH